MEFIGGTNDGRSDGGLPDPSANYYRIPILGLDGVRKFVTELYYRCDGYWRHESLTDEQFKTAVEARKR